MIPPYCWLDVFLDGRDLLIDRYAGRGTPVTETPDFVKCVSVMPCTCNCGRFED